MHRANFSDGSLVRSEILKDDLTLSLSTAKTFSLPDAVFVKKGPSLFGTEFRRNSTKKNFWTFKVGNKKIAVDSTAVEVYKIY